MNNNVEEESDANANPEAVNAEHRCSKCPYVSEFKQNLKRHELKCKGTEILTCPDCKKSFPSKFNLQRHRKTHQRKETVEEERFPCTMCNKTFKFDRNRK